MPRLTDARYIRAIMQKHNVHFSKKMGQNFLINPSVCPRIAELGGAGPEIGALEIGPGIGVLTAELAQRCGKVVAIELDTRLLPVLEETLAEFNNISIVQGDVLKIDLHDLIARMFPGMDVILCANLPYYITSPVVMRLLESRLPLRSITVMVQKEAAQRICAPLPSRQAGAITAAIHYYTEPKILFEVSPGSFLPPPDVQSAVIRLDLRREPPVSVPDEGMLFRVIRASFAQRRKTLLNCLCEAFPHGKPAMADLLAQTGIAPGARAEQLKLEDFAAIATALTLGTDPGKPQQPTA